MSTIKLFWLREDPDGQQFEELHAEEHELDQELQQLIEQNLYPLLGIRVLASNYPLHSRSNEIIPTLGIDENDRPVIVHYGSEASTLNQGLFHLNWLLDHRGDYNLLLYHHFGADAHVDVQWHIPRLVCLGEHVASYAVHTAAQSALSVDIMRYRFHSDNLLLLERLNSPLGPNDLPADTLLRLNGVLHAATGETQRLFLAAQQTILDLAEDIEIVVRGTFVLFRRIRNVAALQLLGNDVALYLNLEPDQVSIDELSEDNIRYLDTAVLGGIGNLEAILADDEDLSDILPLLQRSVDLG